MIRNLRELYQYRALLWALTVRELRARYRASVLGFLWTFLNPSLSMAVYALVFGLILGSDVPQYPYFLFCGLLPWIYFSTSLSAGTSAVSDRRDLLTKVRFPAQVLPATVVFTNLLNFVLSLPLLLVLGGIYGAWPTWHLVFIIPVLLVQTFFTLAVAYFLSALNVAFRDLQHMVGNLLQLMFFVTPVLWSLEDRIKDTELQRAILYGNPLASLMAAWRAIFYSHQMPDMAPLGSVALLSLALMWLASGVFERRREEFAELV